MNEGLALRWQLTEVVALPRDEQRDQLPNLRERAATLRSHVGALTSALPDDVLDELKAFPRHVEKDLGWLDDGLRRPNLGTAHGAVDDILERRGPLIWRQFEGWCDRHSASDSELDQKVERLLNIGQADSALRKAWAVFGSRLRDKFGLPDGIDGDALAVKIFGPEGATEGRLPGPEREGYLQLLKGLYALHRNDVVHKDEPSDIGATEAILILLGGVLVRMDSLD